MSDPIIKRIKIETVYSEEKGQYSAEFHYRFDKNLNRATEHSTGNPDEYYTKVTIVYKEPIDAEKLMSWHQSRAPLYNPEHTYTEEELRHIIPISKEEYEAATQ